MSSWHEICASKKDENLGGAPAVIKRSFVGVVQAPRVVGTIADCRQFHVTQCVGVSDDRVVDHRLGSTHIVPEQATKASDRLTACA